MSCENYDDYEKLCKEQEEINGKLLKIFEEELIQSGLSNKTIDRHVSNVDFYINDYLLFTRTYPMEEGVVHIDDFLGYFFIRKCMWSTPATIKSTAASIKKFYNCMLTHDKITAEDYEHLCMTIKQGMEHWQRDCAMYNDPDGPSPFDYLDF